MKIDSQKQYIHIERDNKEERIIIDAKNISSEDTIYLLTEFIYFVTNKENVPADGFCGYYKICCKIKNRIRKKE